MPNFKSTQPYFIDKNNITLPILYEAYEKMVGRIMVQNRELDYIFGHLDESNVMKARAVIAEWIYANTIIASQIQSGTLTLTEGMTIVNSAGTVEITSTSFTFTNTEGTVTVSADGLVIETDDIYISLTTAGFTMKRQDGSIIIDTTGITLENGQITIKNSAGDSIVLDQYGINPTFLRWFSNLWCNSESMIYDTSYVLRFASGAGVTSSDSATFIGQRSIKITPGSTYAYTPESGLGNAYQNPQWLLPATRARISFWSKYGQARFKLKDQTSGNYITLTKSDGTTTDTIDFPAMANWDDDPHTCAYDVSTYTDVRPEITNIGATDLYINAPQNTADKTGKWAQLYIAGKYSSANSVGLSIDDGLVNLFVETALPSYAKNKDVLIDTDDYSRYDRQAFTATGSDTVTDEEFVEFTGSTAITYTLSSTGATAGCIKLLKNSSTAIVTIVATINGVSGYTLYPGEPILKLIWNGTDWRA